MARLGGLSVLVIGLAVALLPLDLAALLVLGSLAVGIALRDPAGALYLAVLSVPFQDLVELPAGLSLTQAALLLAVASLGLHTLAEPERPLRLGRVFVPLALFVWALGLTTAMTPYSQAEALRATARWATVLLIYLLAVRASEGRAWRTWGLVACLLIAPAATAIVGLVQFWFGLGPASFGVGGGRVRAYGTIGQPNSFAGYMNQGWPLAAGLSLFALLRLWGGAPRRTALLVLLGAGTAGGLMGAALLASFSRGGWVGAVGGGLVGLAVTAALLPQVARPLLRQGALALGSGLLILILLGGSGLLPTALTGRVASLVGNLRLFDARGVEITAANFAVVERMAHLQAAWHMVERYPLSGVGPGNYDRAYEAPPRPDERPISIRPWHESRGHAHNYYLHLAAEAGLIGLTAYLGLLGALGCQALRAIRAARHASWPWQGLTAGACGVIAAVATHNLFENLHVLNMGVQLGTIWALLVIIEREHTP
ncbi:MAG: O-antigen ligase family protein [Oscillochloridaceae bacterium umkhey_bin13]